ncbi:MAG: hypothetical protein U0670_23520 [Anaerolineae bacterium]
MRVNSTQTIAYQFLTHFVVLMLVYAASVLLGAVKFLGADALADTLPYSQVAQISSTILLLALLSGGIGGGLYALSQERSDKRFPYENVLRWARRGWTLLCVLTAGAGLLGLLKGRTGLELPPLLDALLIVVLALILFVVVRGVPRWWSLPLVWTLGITAVLLGEVVGLLPVDPAHDRLLGVLAVGLRDTLGIGLLAVALIFWQMQRFSDLSPGWVNIGVYSVGGFWSMAAALLTLQSLVTLGVPAAVQVGVLGVIALPVIAAIFASHAYLALSHRNTTRTLSAHWVSLAIVLLLIGVGLLGALNALPDVNRMIAGTRLTDLQHTLILLAFAAALFGTVNQVGAELREENRRITGLAPFWLVGFGLIVGAIGLGGAGIVQIYLERLLSVGYLETQTLIVPLYTVWVIGWAAVGLGLIGYALGFWVRRVRNS